MKKRQFKQQEKRFERLLTKEQREEITKAVHKVAKEYGETLRMLGRS